MLLVPSVEKRNPKSETERRDEPAREKRRFSGNLAQRFRQCAEFSRIEDARLVKPHVGVVIGAQCGVDAVAQRKFDRVHARNERFCEIDIPEIIGNHLEVAAAVWSITFQPIVRKHNLEIGDELSNHPNLRMIRRVKFA